MKYALIPVMCALLLPPSTAWAQQNTESSDTEMLRSLRQQVTTMRRQLAAARSELAAATSARQSVQTQIGAVQHQLQALTQELARLKAEVGGLRSNSVWDLNGYLTFEILNGYPTALFRGVNVQIVNGMGDTQTLNGTGNLIVGYNRPSVGEFVCSVGFADSASACATNGGVWAQSLKGGSHNIVGGDFNNYSSWGGLVFGQENALSAPYASVLGGARNRAAGSFASIVGGTYNTASGIYSSVSAGSANHASGSFAAVAGGMRRIASGPNDWAAPR